MCFCRFLSWGCNFTPEHFVLFHSTQQNVVVAQEELSGGHICNQNHVLSGHPNTLYQIAFSLYHQRTGEGRGERISSYIDDFSTFRTMATSLFISRAVKPGAHIAILQSGTLCQQPRKPTRLGKQSHHRHQSRLSHAKSDVCGWLWEECQSREGGGSTGLMNNRLVVDHQRKKQKTWNM